MESTIPDLDALPRRFDRAGELRAPFRREDGVVLAEGVATREGLLCYKRADGSERIELVTREAVLDTARSLPRSPMTLLHPKRGFVSPETVREDGVGDVDGEAVVEEDAQGAFARVKVALRRADAISAFDSGTHELSCGYSVTLDESPGEHPVFGRYDARQIGRRCNHLALVPKGRNGPDVALRADSDDAAGFYLPTPTRETPMNPTLAALLTTLGVERLDDETAALTAGMAAVKQLRTDAEDKPSMEEEMAALRKERDDLAEELKAAKDECGASKTSMDEMKGKLDAATAKLAELEKASKDRKDAADLADLQAVAVKVGVKPDGLDLPALRLAVAKTRVDSVTADSADAYIDGILDAVRKDSAKRDSRYDAFKTDPAKRADASDKPAGDPWLTNQRTSKEG